MCGASSQLSVLSVADWTTAVLGLILHSVVKVGFVVTVEKLIVPVVCMWAAAPGHCTVCVCLCLWRELSCLLNEVNTKLSLKI